MNNKDIKETECGRNQKKRDFELLNMKLVVAIVFALSSSVTIDITNENLLKTCTVDDIDFDCNNGQINFGVENCQIDGSTFFKAVGTDSKCLINSHRMQLEYESCGTTKILNDNEMIYTITLGQFLTDEGVIYNKKRSFSCKVGRKHAKTTKYSTVTTKYRVQTPSEDKHKRIDGIWVAKEPTESFQLDNQDETTNRIYDNENEVDSENGTGQPQNSIAEDYDENDNLMVEDGDMFLRPDKQNKTMHNSGNEPFFNDSIDDTFNIFVISINFILLMK